MFSKSSWDPIVDFLKIFGFVFFITGFWIVTPVMLIIFAAYLCSMKFALFLPVISIYLIWFAMSYHWPECGSMPWTWYRKNAIFMKWCADYFKYRIVKTADLPPDRNYIVGSHPHGIMCLGMTQSFASYVAGITDLYQGFKMWTVTLSGQFLYPLRREFLMIGGSGTASKQCLTWILNQKEKGQAVTIVVGGLNECLMTQPGKYRLKLKDRKGFIKLALTEGADLVPMFHFGENEAYKPVFGMCEKRLRNMQCHLMSTFGFCPPIFIGRSLLGLPWGGLAPFQVRMESVIGAAIRVEKNQNPTQEEVHYQKLIDLFETHKSNYGIRAEQRIILY